ncbi:ABC transporter ATP-binding protein [Halorussus halophilus]|uniref:ABC transporter ATP-binding protein n=1 Tax=Halorussus halophilus TaxID=2650975 RepID=UPI001301676E|nr:ABC transporter ATP-binding protein [Halorussus halophilus]
MAERNTEPLLSVRNLSIRFHTDEGVVHAVDGIDFEVGRGETVCLVGESGSGKTVTGESLTRLLKSPPAEIEGEVRFDGQNLLDLPESAMNDVRGDRIAHVFQNPQGALNPVYTVGWQVSEAIRLHRDVSKKLAREEAIDLLTRVGIPEAAARYDDYPHEFSGGQKQRVVVAMALAADPDLLVADEPTTALDVTIQSQILRLLADLKRELGMAVLLITHDLSVVAEVADRVVVMYAGKVMEQGDVYDLFETPAHPYTRALLACLPGRGVEFRGIGGRLPDPTDPPAGCRFHPRCPYAVAECESGEQPPLYTVRDEASSNSGDDGDTHRVSCVYYDGSRDPTEITDGESFGEQFESDSERRFADGGGNVEGSR